MLKSNQHKIELCGWLKKKYPTLYNNPVKMHAFLFLYECVTKTEDGTADFSNLYGYKKCLFFRDVFNDYMKNFPLFDAKVNSSYDTFINKANDEIKIRIDKVGFLTYTLSDKELFEFLHSLNIWKCKSEEITEKETGIQLKESDFSEEDLKKTQGIKEIIKPEQIWNSRILKINEKCFIIDKDNMQKLTESHIDILFDLTENADIHSPIFIVLDEQGGIHIM